VHEAWHYDGESAVRRDVQISADGAAGLTLHERDGTIVAVPKATLTFVESRRECNIYGRSDIPGWRLGLAPDAAADLAAVLPGRAQYGSLIDRIGLGRAVVAGLAVSALVIFAGMRFPSWVAPYVPMSWEERFGEALVGDFGGRFCAGAGGQEALGKLAARLSPGSARLNIRVVNVRMVNAAAFPGGNIVIFDKLLKEAEGPDEVAGILAHEIAHVEERHTTEAMIRQMGLGVIVSAFGGTTGANIDTLLSARYSHSAEAEADTRAIDALRRGNISPLGTAAFFERLARDEAKFGRAATALSYVASHPMSAERQKQFRDSAVRGRSYRPALSAAEWKALAGICTNDPARAEKTLDLSL
jgi:hypothetical protein